MSNDYELDAKLRTDKGKGASRRLRRTHKFPGIIYGGDSEPVAIELDHFQMSHRLENEAFYSHILTLNVEGKSQEAVLKDLQRHPARAEILHADFQRVSKDRLIHVHVPLHFLNEEKCPGVKLGGGSVSKIMNEVEVMCFPQNLPEYIEADLLELELGDSIQLSQLVLPEGVELVALSHGDEQHDTAVVNVHKLRGMSEEDEDSAAPEEGQEGGDADDKSDS